MINDYRNTKYCPELNDIENKKDSIVNTIKNAHPKAVDMHTYLSKNDVEYKNKFIKAYNGKCSYCGVSIELISKGSFEIDHYIYEKSPKFLSKKDAGYISNLVLACHDCNQKKSSFLIPDENYNVLYPDGDGIRNTFWRDEMYYIKISDALKGNQVVTDFYMQIQLGAEIHRLDFLLMSLLGLQKEHTDNEKLYVGIGKIIDILKVKRNLM